MRRFDIGISLMIPLILLLAIWLGWSIWNQQYRALVLPTLALFAYPLGIEICVSIASILAAIVGIYYNINLDKFLVLIFTFFGGIEALALLHWLCFIPLGLLRTFRNVAKFEMGLFYIAAHLAPLLSLPLMYMWLLKHIIKRNWSIQIRLLTSKSENKTNIPYTALLFFIFTIFLSVVAALYPYNYYVNPQQQKVGSDVEAYTITARIIEANFSEISTGLSSSRPIVFLVIAGCQRLFGIDAVSAVKFLPLLLNPLLCASVAFLTLETLDDWWTASWASFFTICGYHVSVGTYAFFLSNMLGLCFSFFSLGFLFRALRNEHDISLMVAGFFGALLCFTHPWTFDQYIFPVIVIVGLLWYFAIKHEYDYGKVKMLLYYLTILGIAELLKSKVWGGVGGVHVSRTATERVVSLSYFWRENIFCFRTLYGGLLSVVVLFFLAILGIYFLGHCNIPRLYFTVFIIASSFVYLIGDSSNKGRILYNMPIGLFAAYGLNWLLKQKIIDDYKHVYASFVVLNLVVYLFRSLANIVY